MENDVLDLSRNFIENQKRQIELAKQLIECANGDEEVIGMANEMIKSCEKSISIEENMRYKTYTREEYLEWCRKNNVKIHYQSINVTK